MFWEDAAAGVFYVERDFFLGGRCSDSDLSFGAVLFYRVAQQVEDHLNNLI